MKEPVYEMRSSEKGMAMLTVMLLLIIMTVLGLTAITVTGLENRMAGNVLGQETATVAAESCVGTAVNIIQQTIAASALPANYYGSGGPVPASNATTLYNEILGISGYENYADVAVGSGAAPNTSVSIAAYAVSGDIDRLFAKAKVGSGMQFASASEGLGGGAGGFEVEYRIDCTAQNTATGTTNRIVAVYSCSLTGDTCQKKIS
jgi:Tfp pilus assembly protein PilX